MGGYNMKLVVVISRGWHATAPCRRRERRTGARTAQVSDSTWELIKKNGQVAWACSIYPPYFVRDKASGEWEGAMVEMGKDIANELKVKYVPVEVGGFAEAVLSLQAGKVDMNSACRHAAPRNAIDFAGPIYWIEWVTVNNPNFKGKDWADYNKENVKVAVMTGTSDELLLRKMAPKATRVEFKLIADVALAVSSGRADAFTHDGAGEHGDEAEEPGARRLHVIPSRAWRCRAISGFASRTISAGRSSSTAGPSGTSCWATTRRACARRSPRTDLRFLRRSRSRRTDGQVCHRDRRRPGRRLLRAASSARRLHCPLVDKG
jgi:ABC-type amino acid transport substrate-binding protein